MKKGLAIILVAMLCMGMASCGGKEEKRFEAEFLTLFDTVTEIVAYEENKETFSAHAQMIHDELLKYHQLYDIYHEYPEMNNLKTINDQAGIAPVKVDEKIIDLLLLAKEEYLLTNGKMNVAMGSLLSIWHDYRTEGMDDPSAAKLPPQEALIQAARHTNIDDVIIDAGQGTVFLADPEMRLDVGSIAKGYATEQVSRFAEEQGFRSGLISVGGNVRAIGNKPDGSKWNVGIRNPDGDAEKKNLVITYLEEASLVTSGNYERYYVVDGKRYHHIINPVTLFPADYFTSVTIVCADSGRADALSTAVYNMPYEEGKAYVEGVPKAEAMWVMPDGEILFSSGFDSYLTKGN